MNRRTFLQQASVGAIALSDPVFSIWSKNRPMGIVVHSYAIRWNAKTPSQRYPGFSNALDLLTHCHQIGAGGVQVVVNGWAADFARKVRDKREQFGMYLEGSISLPKTTSDVAKFEQDVVNAKEAGANVLRTVCSVGRRYESYHSVEAFQDMKKNALASLRLSEPILRKHKVKLAVENHKDWRAHELVAILKQLNNEWIGATLDFGNNIALLEEPMYVVQTLAPYVFTTHVKDMAMVDYADGFLLSEVPLGKGCCDVSKMVELCLKHNPDVTFNLEMITRDPLEIPCLTDGYWSTFTDVSGGDLARALRLVKQHPYTEGLPRISPLEFEQKLTVEENNILACLDYGREKLGL